jgi:uncharacterized protein|nr:unknown [Zea mays]
MASGSKPDSMDTDPLGGGLSIAVERNPPESRLQQLGVRSWPK